MGKDEFKRSDLLKIPDHVALKSATEYSKSLEKKLENSQALVRQLEAKMQKSNRKYNALKEALTECLTPSTTHAIMKTYNRKLNSPQTP